MRNLVQDLKPTEFADLTALIALYRPGPLGSGMDRMYVERKNGRQPVTFDHPLLEPILGETYGIILYQEQVMNIAKTLAGFTLGQADVLRKAMGKKDDALMDKQASLFIEGCVANGLDRTRAEHIWHKSRRLRLWIQ
jgi:DNA polymerase-3 subunit alpha